MAGDDNSLWAQQDATATTAAVDRLSRMVAGNDQLVTQPGLVQAMFEQNATPQQASAINSFLHGLEAEKRVRNAALAGTPIKLNGDERTALDAMGIPYQSVLYTEQNAKDKLAQQMAAKGKKPVLDDNGNVQTDGHGNPLTQDIKPKKVGDGGGFFGGVGDFFGDVGGFFKKVGTGIWHGDVLAEFSDTPTVGELSGGNYASPESIAHASMEGYNYISSTASKGDLLGYHPELGIGVDPAHPGQDPDEVDRDLMVRMGYDPDSWASKQAFKAKGYAHHDTSDIAQKWDDEHPNSDMTGHSAVLEAETFAADPEKYQKGLLDLPDAEYAKRIEFLSSNDFQNLVKRVNGSRADIGADFARGIGIDPVEHSTSFTVAATAANLAAMFAIDPLAVGLGAYTKIQKASVAFKGAHDAAGIEKILRPTGHIYGAQQRTIANLHDIVNYGNAIRAAEDAGDAAQAAKLAANARANPFAGFLPDFMAKDQILTNPTTGGALLKPEDELLELGKGGSPFVTGKTGEVVDTYDKAVDYIASKTALLRLSHGYAPVETSYMPGAISSRGYSLLKGRMTGWSSGRTAAKSVKAEGKFVATVSSDPGRLKWALNNKLLTETMAVSDDAIEALSGKVIAAETQAAASSELAAKFSLEAEAAHKAERGALSQGKTTGKWRPDYPELQATAAQSRTVADNAAAQLEADRTGLKSAKRALGEAKAVEPGLAVTDAGRGYLRGNQRMFGRLADAPAGVRSAIDKQLAGEKTNVVDKAKLALYGQLGTGQRAREVVTRFTNWLPRDTYIDVSSAASADTIQKIARTYMSPGDSHLLSLRWMNGNIDTRKTIVEGLKDQIAHASGLTRTTAGRDMVAAWKSEEQEYLVFGQGFTDANGVKAGMYPGQIDPKFHLPNFGAVHQASAKIGLYEATMGKLLTRHSTDMLMGGWKIGALLTPVTATRAIIESWLNSSAEGLLRKGVAAKAAQRESGLLSVAEIHRSRPVDKVLSVPAIQAVGRFYRETVLRHASEAEAEAVRTMPADLHQGYVHEQTLAHAANELDPGNTREVGEILNAGLTPSKVRYVDDEVAGARLKGYEITDATEGVHGANRYAANLATRVNKSPEVARAIIARIENPELGPDGVIEALAKSSLMRDSMFGRKFIREDGVEARATTDAEVALGKQQWADAITEEFRFLVTGRNAQVQTKILDYVKTHGHGPDPDWILKNVKGQNRPQALLRPVFVATTPGGAQGLAEAVLEKGGKAYRWTVERLIQRHATSPLFGAAYGEAKVGLEGFKQALIHESGLSEEAAERTAAVMAAQQAWSRVARMLDDPHMKSQVDVVGRSFFAFSRATTMMIRRWGSTFWRNPAQARRLQLAGEAAVHSGLAYQDTNGEWMFAIPGSGVAQEVLMHAMSHFPGLKGLAEFPVADYTGRAASIIPGSDNPLQYNTNPITSVSARWIASHFPEHRDLFDEVDRFLNGDEGQGQGFFTTIMPNIAKKVYDTDVVPGFGKDGRDSVVASSMVGSLYYLYAAGLVPDENASDAEMEEFYGRLRTQTKSVLAVRAIFGLFSPAVVSVPHGADYKADYAFAARGAKTLRDEYRMILNDVDGDIARATAIWVHLHPDMTVYQTATSQSTTSHAVMPATKKALDWMERNTDFIGKYKSVAAFFIPEDSKNDPFSMNAYRVQLEEHLRERKTPEEFLDSVRYSSGAGPYYAMKDEYEKDLAAAKAAGDDEVASARRADWAAWSRTWKAMHPTFAAETAGYPERVRKAKGQLGDIETMLERHEVPGGPRVTQALDGMIRAYKGYEQFRAAHPGNTNLAQAQRASAGSELQTYMSRIVAAAPEISDVYSGVFRVLNSQLETLDEGDGG